MNVPSSSFPDPSTSSPSTAQKPRNIVPTPANNSSEQRSSFSRQQRPSHPLLFDREREHSAGGWSASSVGTGASGPSSMNRSVSKRVGSRARPGLGGPGVGKKRDKHSLALLSIREFLKGRSCYDCLPVSFRLVVLDTKLVVKPALEVMWQAGIVSAPLWQSASPPRLATSDDASSTAQTDNALSPSALSAKLAAGEMSDTTMNTVQSPRSPPSSSSLGVQASLRSALSAGNSASVGSPDAAAAKVMSQTAAPPPGKAGFAGMLTVNDIIHLIQYYYQHSSYDNAAQDVEKFRLEMLREIEQTLHVPQPPLLSIEPLRPLYDACELLIKTHARRLPLLDYDEQTGMETVVSVLTQYRVLKFIAMNCRETAGLNRTLRSLGIGTYVADTRGVGRSNTMNAGITSTRGSVSSSRRSSNVAAASGMLSPPPAQSTGMAGDSTSMQSLTATAEALPSLEEAPADEGSPAFSPSPHFFPGRTEAITSDLSTKSCHPIATATLDTTVFDVVHVFSEKGISAVPIVDEDGLVVDIYETVDVIDLVRSGAYQSLDLTIRQALSKRSKDFPGVMTCGPDDTLATIFTLLRTKRVHRLLILEPEPKDEIDPLDIDEKDKSTTTETAKNDPLAGLGEIKHRKRGKLVGILCLSDILRYVIGGKANIVEARAATAAAAAAAAAAAVGSSGAGGGTSGNVSASGSAVGDLEARGSVGSSVEGTSGEASGVEGGAATAFEGAARPVDMPPTIAEHPKEQQKLTQEQEKVQEYEHSIKSSHADPSPPSGEAEGDKTVDDSSTH